VSDLSSKSTEEDLFDPNNFVRSLCLGSKVIIPHYINIQFLSGWSGITEKLFNTINKYHVNLIEIHDKYSVLDVEFEITKQRGEANVWRAIYEARYESIHTCAKCGENKFSRRNASISKFCHDCKKELGKIGKTGTWLDKY
jgi:hypothetical protein